MNEPSPASSPESPDATIAALRKTLLRDPTNVLALVSLAESLFRAGRHREAIGRLRQVVKIRPGDTSARLDLGIALARVGDVKGAERVLQETAALDPRAALAHLEVANVLLRHNSFDAAEQHYLTAMSIDPMWSAPHTNLAALRLARALPHEAIELYRDALALNPNDVEAANGLGSALLTVGRADDAVAQLHAALAVAPLHVATRLNLGRALRATGAIEAAIQVHAALTVDHPTLADAWDDLAIDRRDADDLNGALAAAERAVAADPRRAHSQMHLGNLLADAGRWSDAIAAYHRTLRLSPRFATARWNLGLAELTVGDFKNGWDNYEARWDCVDFSSMRCAWPGKPLSPGASVAGKTVLVHAEQGFGDSIQFLRFVPLLAARGASVFVQMPRPLVALARRMEGIGTVIADDDSWPATDFHVPFMSLPRVLDLRRPDGSAVPYLRGAGSSRVAGAPLRVGIAWAGSGGFANDRRRSLRLAEVERWFDVAGVEWVGLQKEIPPQDNASAERLVRRLPSLLDATAFEDFAETADAIQSLDLVISVDTAVAHLAGAMGTPVWILLPFSADFRWLLNRADSPWYPSARLFRAQRVDCWDGIPDAVEDALHAHRGADRATS